jgi:hypothetical protein
MAEAGILSDGMGVHAQEGQLYENSIPAPERPARQKARLAGRGHTLLIVVYHLLKDPTLEYRELGEDYFDRRDAEQTKKQLIKRLGKLGYKVTLTPKTE